ncbi:MAG: hypothetical protein NC412_08795 [Roseburia sp.]|nr:hypothetical protein [Roseburia sp.]MCM1277369.1 hypothetical protein [Robinsoniella sp.]
MDFMDIFNFIASTCSIMSLIVSLIIASKVTKLTKSNNNNSGQIHQGDGDQNIAQNHSLIGDGTIIHNDYTNAEIIGEIDEPPTLTENEYYIYNDNYDKYNLGISGKSCEMININKNDIMIFNIDFSDVISSPHETRFIGYSFKSLPMRDWRSFILENYKLSFTYSCTDSIKEVWIEITNKVENLKLYKFKLELSHNKNEFSLSLNTFSNVIGAWKYVDEICFVFFPEDCIKQKGCVYITNLKIHKSKQNTL